MYLSTGICCKVLSKTFWKPSYINISLVTFTDGTNPVNRLHDLGWVQFGSMSFITFVSLQIRMNIILHMLLSYVVI